MEKSRWIERLREAEERDRKEGVSRKRHTLFTAATPTRRPEAGPCPYSAGAMNRAGD